jgi:hypothetical protein
MFVSLLSLDNIQVCPSWKVNINYYQIEQELFPKALGTKGSYSFKFDIWTGQICRLLVPRENIVFYPTQRKKYVME